MLLRLTGNNPQCFSAILLFIILFPYVAFPFDLNYCQDAGAGCTEAIAPADMQHRDPGLFGSREESHGESDRPKESTQDNLFHWWQYHHNFLICTQDIRFHIVTLRYTAPNIPWAVIAVSPKNSPPR